MKLVCAVITVFHLIQLNDSFNPRLVNIRHGMSKSKNDIESRSVNISAVCNSRKRKCIWKCCPSGMYMKPRKKCIPSNITMPNIKVYDSEFKITTKSFESMFQVVPWLMRYNSFLEKSFLVSLIAESYLNEDGNLYIEFSNAYRRWYTIKTDRFCVEVILKRNTRKLIFMADVEIENFIKRTVNNKYALVITIGFLFLTVLPYVVLSRLRDYNGLILIFFLVLFIIPPAVRLYLLLSTYTTLETLIMGLIYCFSFTSSICWTNIMFYRILKLERNDSTGVQSSTLATKKAPMLEYCTYAFGLPLLLILLTIFTEINDFSHVKWVVTPKIVQTNFVLVEGPELLYYLYTPILLLLSFNWIVCVKNVMRFYKKPREFPILRNDSMILKSPLSSTSQYVKLLVLLTVYLVLKVVGILSPDTDIEYDTYHYFFMCIGPVIFITFVIDKHVWKMIKEFLTEFKNRFMTFISVYYY